MLYLPLIFFPSRCLYFAGSAGDIVDQRTHKSVTSRLCGLYKMYSRMVNAFGRLLDMPLARAVKHLNTLKTWPLNFILGIPYSRWAFLISDKLLKAAFPHRIHPAPAPRCNNPGKPCPSGVGRELHPCPVSVTISTLHLPQPGQG